MKTPMQITAEDAPTALASSKAAPRPIVLMLHLDFEIEPHLVQIIRGYSEILALLLPPGDDSAAFNAHLEKALGDIGANGPSKRHWFSVDFPNGATREAPAMIARITRPNIDFRHALDEETVMKCLELMTREAGQIIAEATGAIGWRRAKDAPGATSTLQALGMAFDDLNALYEAHEIKKELACAQSTPPSASRLAL